jgi:hypothetical protein
MGRTLPAMLFKFNDVRDSDARKNGWPILLTTGLEASKKSPLALSSLTNY